MGLAAGLGCSVVSLAQHEHPDSGRNRRAAPPGVRLTSGIVLDGRGGGASDPGGVPRPGPIPAGAGDPPRDRGRRWKHRTRADPPARRPAREVSARRSWSAGARSGSRSCGRRYWTCGQGSRWPWRSRSPPCAGANVIAVATNASEPLVHPRHLGTARPWILVDVSVPSAIAPEVRRMAGVKVMPLSDAPLPQDPGLRTKLPHRPRTHLRLCSGGDAPRAGTGGDGRTALTGAIRPQSAAVLDGLALDLGLLGGLGEDLDPDLGDLADPRTSTGREFKPLLGTRSHGCGNWLPRSSEVFELDDRRARRGKFRPGSPDSSVAGRRRRRTPCSRWRPRVAPCATPSGSRTDSARRPRASGRSPRPRRGAAQRTPVKREFVEPSGVAPSNGRSSNPRRANHDVGSSVVQGQPGPGGRGRRLRPARPPPNVVARARRLERALADLGIGG